MDVRERAASVLSLVRYVWAMVRARRQWVGPVWVRVTVGGPRDNYAMDPKTGEWFAPARWRAEPEYATGRVAA
jgi:hypothetical protein